MRVHQALVKPLYHRRIRSSEIFAKLKTFRERDVSLASTEKSTVCPPIKSAPPPSGVLSARLPLLAQEDPQNEVI
eukprot:1177121-Prorocentrum_minimum.AAC.8